MLDHTGFGVSDFQHKQDFYEKLLAPLGITILVEPRGRQPALSRPGRPFSGSRIARQLLLTIRS
jgi:hypothetical protein